MKFLLVGVLLLSLTAIAQTNPEVQKIVVAESLRLGQCPEIYKLSPAPIHMKLVWRRPSRITVVNMKDVNRAQNEYQAIIEFAVGYEQSDFFRTEEEARDATQFTRNFDLLRRNTYSIRAGTLFITKSEFKINNHWESGKADHEFACWQTEPSGTAF